MDESDLNPCRRHDIDQCRSEGSFPKTVSLWDFWDPQLGNISRIPKPHSFRKTTLYVVFWY
jgi:hypothetical protein